jgi:hypothetical protein
MDTSIFAGLPMPANPRTVRGRSRPRMGCGTQVDRLCENDDDSCEQQDADERLFRAGAFGEVDARLAVSAISQGASGCRAGWASRPSGQPWSRQPHG